MSGDLVSLRMLLIAAAQPDRELWRQAAAMASVPVDFTAHASASAACTFANDGADICVVDGDLPDADQDKVIATARALNPAPLVFMSSLQGSASRERIDGMLRKPSNVDEARKLVEICVRAKIPSRVLIVDDSSTMRSIVRKILSASHFKLDIHEAAEGIAALNQLRDGNFHMVFLDYNMPGFNGLETLAEIKRETPNVAVVMMTSMIDPVIAERAKAAGVLAFLKKPFYPADIDRVLERYYGLHMSRG
ncbi:MAG: response regulator [Rhizobiales bacterium]|nr:response regulator [Hyphomicrobiales bacterium]